MDKGNVWLWTEGIRIVNMREMSANDQYEGVWIMDMVYICISIYEKEIYK